MSTGSCWQASALHVTHALGLVSGAMVRERMLQRPGELLPSCHDSGDSSLVLTSLRYVGALCEQGNRKTAHLVQGSCSASHDKGQVEQPLLVRSCRVPTEPGSARCQCSPLPWQENLTLTGCLHQDDLWGATPHLRAETRGHARLCWLG